MANISTAYGKVFLKAKTEDDLRFLYEMIVKYATHFWYLTELFEEYDSKMVYNYEEDGPLCFESSFDGSGRWEYGNNIKSFYRWLSDEMTDNEKVRFKGMWFEMEFDYSEEEPGCQILCDVSKALVTHESGSDVTFYDAGWGTNYDYTANNLMKLGFYDYAWDLNEDCMLYVIESCIGEVAANNISKELCGKLSKFLKNNDETCYLDHVHADEEPCDYRELKEAVNRFLKENNKEGL